MRNGMLFVSVAVFSACNPNKVTLLRARTVDTGAQCQSTGVAIETGKDINDNGVLDDTEVNAAQTTYVCDGRSGDAGVNGANGLNALSVTSSEPRGEHCPSGGVRIDTGLDLDASGTLSASEVTSTQYVCNPSVPVVYYGDLVIRSAADVAVLSGVEVMTGALTIGLSPTPELSFPSLKTIAGGLWLIDESCGGECNALSPGVTSLSFPALTQLGSLTLSARDLVSFVAPKLSRAGSMSISNNGALATLAFDQLVSAESIDVTQNQLLTTLSLPRLVLTNSLTVSSNPSLVTLSTPTLTSVMSNLEVSSNSSLPLCTVQQLASRLRTDPLTFSIGGNATTACVPAEVCDLWPIDGLGTLRFCGWPLDLAAARAACQTLGAGADLAWFTSDAEWLAFKAKTLEYQTSSWIGYSDEAAEGTWLALNGVSSYSPASRPDFWQSGTAPVDAAHALNGAMMAFGTVTDAATTSAASGFICRAP